MTTTLVEAPPGHPEDRAGKLLVLAEHWDDYTPGERRLILDYLVGTNETTYTKAEDLACAVDIRNQLVMNCASTKVVDGQIAGFLWDLMNPGLTMEEWADQVAVLFEGEVAPSDPWITVLGADGITYTTGGGR